jgi:hypothetical protein
MRTIDLTLRTLAACCTLSAALLASPPSLAAGVSPSDATPAQKKEAMDHFMTGKQAIEAKNWEKAALELRASLDAVDSPNARLELARALRESGNLVESWAEYKRVFDSATALASKEPRYAQTAEAATSERGELESKLAFVVVTIQNAPADASLKVGGKSIPSSEWVAPIVVPAGTVDVVLSDASGKELARQTVTATVGQKTPTTVDAKPGAAAAPGAPPVPANPDPDDKPDFKPGEGNPADTGTTSGGGGNAKLRTYAYIAGGVGVAGLAMFTIFGLMDNSTYSDLQSACPNNACPASKQSEIDSGRTQQTLANVGLVVGAVGVATGATLFVLSLSKSSPAPAAAPATGLVVTPGFVGLRGTL